MLWTLHSYILRDLLKTFLLTILAITVIITMGGGVINVIRFEGVTSGDVLRIVPLMVPVVVTIFMPVAALFAATSVYGRLAADAEMQACRAAGINIHWLFLPVLLLALGVGGFTMLSGSLIIPACVKQIERFSRANARDWVDSQLKRRGSLHFRNRYFLGASSSRIPRPEELAQAGLSTDGFSYLYILSPSVLELAADGTISQFASAKGGLLQFDTRTSPLQASLIAENGRVYRPPEHAVEFSQQRIGPIVLPMALPERPGWADLPTLLRWQSQPWTFVELAQKLRAFLGRVAVYAKQNELARSFNAERKLTIADDDLGYTIQAASLVSGPKDLALVDAHVEQRVRGTLKTVYDAREARIVVRPVNEDRMIVEIRLVPSAGNPVRELAPGPGGRSSRHEKPLNLPLVNAAVPPEVASLTPPEVLSPRFEIENLPEDLAADRRSVQRESQTLLRKVLAEIHMRLAFTSANIFTLVLAAALGLMFRGAQALSAFALAMLPLGFVLLVTHMGRQVTVDDRLSAAGPYIMWSSLALCALADIIILRWGVKR